MTDHAVKRSTRTTRNAATSAKSARKSPEILPNQRKTLSKEHRNQHPAQLAQPDFHSIAALVSAWFVKNARDLPWRPLPIGSLRDPYACLVSELMLQQTQVSRVVDRFTRFMDRFPTPADLARADETEVLAMWSGLGYYRRAKHLHALARAVVDRFDGITPTDFDELRTLPGVGAYTAGAVASMSIGQRVGAVDANAIRVFLRILGNDADPKLAATQKQLASFGDALAHAAAHAGVVNEAIMELGATVCAPSPRCETCPVRLHCCAYSANTQHQIPHKPPRESTKKHGKTGAKIKEPKRTLYISSALVTNARGSVLVRQRPNNSMWAGMCEPPCVEQLDIQPARAQLAQHLHVPAQSLALIDTIEHETTHRHVVARVYRCINRPTSWRAHRHWQSCAWVSESELDTIALSSLHRKILDHAFG